MNLSPNKRVVFLAFLVLTASETAAQSPQMLWNGFPQVGNPVALEEPAEIIIQGAPDVPFVTVIGIQRAVTHTLLGVLEIDPNHSSFSVVLNGFDPNHLSFGSSFLNGVGATNLSFVPFDATTSPGTELYLQTIALSPGSPYGFEMTDIVGGIALPPVPIVSQVTPNTVVDGTLVVIDGSYLGGVANFGDPPIVTIGDSQVPVVAHTFDQITVQITPETRSGTVHIETVGGANPIEADNFDGYVFVYGETVSEFAAQGGPITNHTTILGEISEFVERDFFLVQANAGDEIFVEAFNFDLQTAQITPFTPSSFLGSISQLNPWVDIRIPSVYIAGAVLEDDNGGPGYAASIGGLEAPRFIAPYDGTYEISLSSSYSLSKGSYIAGIWTRDAIVGESPVIELIHPNLAPVGAPVEIYAYGIDPANPGASTVEFRGPGSSILSVQPYINGFGQVVADVPVGARSGHLRVRDANGAPSPVDSDDHINYLAVQGNPNDANTVTTLVSGDNVAGSINGPYHSYEYDFPVAAGDLISVRVFPFDLVTHRLLDGRIYHPGVLDPEFIVQSSTGEVLFSDLHSGPGAAAEVGGLERPAFIAPATDVLQLTVRGWFLFSYGDFLVEVELVSN